MALMNTWSKVGSDQPNNPVDAVTGFWIYPRRDHGLGI